MNDIVAAFGLFAEPFAVEMEASASDEELLHSLEKAAQKALIYVSIDCEGMYATLVTPCGTLFKKPFPFQPYFSRQSARLVSCVLRRCSSSDRIVVRDAISMRCDVRAYLRLL